MTQRSLGEQAGEGVGCGCFCIGIGEMVTLVLWALQGFPGLPQ